MTSKLSKLTLSAEELELVSNTDWIHAKQRITEQVVQLFGRINGKQRDIVAQAFGTLDGNSPLSIPGKISRGEQYIGLPYVVLDYPRCFNQGDILAIRTLFWWGHFFSVQLLLQGEFRNNNMEALASSHARLSQGGFSLCVAESAWHHHFERDNFLPISEMTEDQFGRKLKGNSFIKIGKRIELKYWDGAEEFLATGFGALLKLLVLRPPGGESGL
jgi:hypothetical protein